MADEKGYMTADDLGANILDQAIGDLISGIHNKNGAGLAYPAEPFYGRLLASLKRATCTEKDKGKSNYVPTAAVGLEKNQIVLSVNLDFLGKYDRVGRRAVLKHEAQHVAHRHLFRFKQGKYQNMRRGNIGMDAVINQFNPEIHNMVDTTTGETFEPIDYKKIPVPGKKNTFAEADRSWQYYYELLEQEQDPKDGEGENGEGGAGEDGITHTSYGDMFDDHSAFGTGGDDETNPEMVEEKLKETIQRCARQAYAGKAPKEIEDILDEIRKESKIPWQVLLRNWFKFAVRQVRELNMLRESLSVEGVFPGHKRNPVPEFHLYADMSGSIADDQAVAFFVETLAIQRKMKATIHLHQFDTMIHKSEIIEKQLPTIKRVACGGTNFQCVVEHARENRIRNIVIMTDGYAPDVDTTGLNVLWVFTTNHQDHGGKSIVIEGT